MTVLIGWGVLAGGLGTAIVLAGLAALSGLRPGASRPQGVPVRSRAGKGVGRGVPPRARS